MIVILLTWWHCVALNQSSMLSIFMRADFGDISLKNQTILFIHDLLECEYFMCCGWWYCCCWEVQRSVKSVLALWKCSMVLDTVDMADPAVTEKCWNWSLSLVVSLGVSLLNSSMTPEQLVSIICIMTVCSGATCSPLMLSLSPLLFSTKDCQVFTQLLENPTWSELWTSAFQ